MNVIEIINEEVKRLFEQDVYRIPELAKLLTRSQYGEDDEDAEQAYIHMLTQAYQKGGDAEVVRRYGTMSGVGIDNISKGRYVFANLYKPDNYNPRFEEE